MKKCVTCGKLKPLSEYHKNSSALDGRRNRCITCRKELETFKSREHNYYKHYPVPSGAVYCIINGSEIVYIGSSITTPYRLYNHFNRKNHTTSNNPFHSLSVEERKSNYTYGIIFESDIKSELRKKEIELIKHFKPKFNKTYNN